MGRVGILLLQMGGPRNLDEIEPYIRTLFRDPYLVRLPPPISWFRRPLSWWVARRRAPVLRFQYEKIGGSSPNNAITGEQAKALQEALGDCGDYRCYAAMAYTPPTVVEALRRSLADGCEHWIALPMFPQYSTASTGAILAELERCRCDLGIASERVTTILRWGARPDFLDAVWRRTQETLAEARTLSDSAPHLVVSAHGLPLSYLKTGDPYVREIEESVAGLCARMPAGQDLTLAFQSRATPVKWVEPSTLATLARLGSEGVKSVVVLPISFVNDHIETLFEIDQLLADAARSAGIEHYRRVPAFNTAPALIAILKALVLEQELG